jgi:D-alanyl-D-alanine carboxypeptidase (penicillin-binding protein 5/6)
MDNSHFENPHGLPAEEQYTSAGDMARLACAYVRRFPQALRYHSMQEYTYSEITQHNRNGLLRKDPAVNGLKTGYVSEAGYHLMATAEKEGLQLVAVVMGTESPSVREREALTLLNHGFRHYAYFRPFQEGDTVTTLRVWKGEADSVPLILGESAALIIPRRKKDSVTWKVETVERAVAPISARQRLGEIVIYLSETPKKSVPLVSAEEVPKGGLFKRLWHSLRLVQVLNWRVVGIVAGAVVVFLLAFAVFSRRRSSRSSSTFRTRR